MSEADKIKEVIKSRGYWEVDFRPNEPSIERFASYADLKEKVRSSVVSIRGWDYPHFGHHPEPYPMNNRIESYVDFGTNKDFWTMFLNGHFYHIFACREDWMSDDVSIFGKHRYSDLEPEKFLGFIMALYSLTEIFEFGIRLAQKEVLGNSVKISVNLHKMQNRTLTTFDPRRFLFRGNYTCREETIPLSCTLSVNDLISEGHEKAVDFAISIFHLFNWLNVRKETLIEEQKKFLEKKF